MFAVLIWFAALLSVADSLWCDDCLAYNKDDCDVHGACQGTYCLYDYSVQHDGQSRLKKTCVDTPDVVFDDGSQLTAFDQCVSKNTTTMSYVVNLCYSRDRCNHACDNPQPMPGPTGLSVICYSCSAEGGQDCNSGTCEALYCTYSSQITPNGQYRTVKGCADVPQLPFDDGSMLTQLDTCVSKDTTTGSNYDAFICNTNFCNAHCPTGAPVVSCTSCTATNASDCTGTTCQGNYCVYERMTSQNHVPSVHRSCSESRYQIFPDGSITETLNQCETKMIAGITSAIEVCNSGPFCATACNSEETTVSPTELITTPEPTSSHTTEESEPGPTVSCYQCQQNNAVNCSTGSCADGYCLYERVTDSSGVPLVRRSCSSSPFAIYPDGSKTQAINRCERKTIDGVDYAVEVCDSGDFCDVDCSAFSSLSTVLSFLLLSVIYLLK